MTPPRKPHYFHYPAKKKPPLKAIAFVGSQLAKTWVLMVLISDDRRWTTGNRKQLRHSSDILTND